MDLTVDKIYEVEDDFQEVFLAKSGIHVRPKLKELKLSTRSIGDTKYNDLYIIEPNKVYYITFNESMEEKIWLHKDDLPVDFGLLTYWQVNHRRVCIYNASKNIVYIQQGTKIGRVQ